MKYWPSFSEYDNGTVSGVALYVAHCELDPIQGLIEQTILANESTLNMYSQFCTHAHETHDFFSESTSMDLQSIFAERIIPLSYESILLILMSKLEESLCTWCRMIEQKIPDCPEFHNQSDALGSAAEYLKKNGGITGIKQDASWERVIAYRDVRNAIVHNGGRIPERNRPTMDKFNIGMSNEDYSVYIDAEKIGEIYSSIIEFVDRVFLLPSSKDIRIQSREN